MRKLILSALLVLGACREAPDPFTVDNPFEGDATGRLTYSVLSDHAPLWSRGSDSIYYDAPTYPGLPPARSMMLGVPRTGGSARPILPSVQVGLNTTPWFAGLAVSRDGNNAAFLELTEVRDREFDYIVCPFAPTGPARDTAGSHSFLKQGVLRVRPVNSTSGTDAARLTVTFAGRTGDNTGAIRNFAHPFHRMFDQDGVPFFRPTWSPDGARLAYSDGSNIRIWTVGQPQSVILPGSEDGVLPAWSPDGNWIAFSKPFRGAAQTFGCEGWRFGDVRPAAFFQTTTYTPYTREGAQLMIVRPDGTGLRSLGIGDGPTWTSNSQTVIAHRDDSLFRIDITAGTGTVIANTVDAFEPMISPDGRFLAFARRIEVGSELNKKGNYDIWVAPF
jgi:hypothetical protein